MASGKLPFNAGTEYILFQKIKEGDFVYPEVTRKLFHNCYSWYLGKGHG